MPKPSKPSPLARKIGRRIRQLRDEMGMTMEKLAYGNDISKGYLSDVENGHQAPSIARLETNAAGLGILPLDLLVFPQDGLRQQVTDALRDASDRRLKAVLKLLTDE